MHKKVSMKSFLKAKASASTAINELGTYLVVLYDSIRLAGVIRGLGKLKG